MSIQLGPCPECQASYDPATGGCEHRGPHSHFDLSGAQAPVSRPRVALCMIVKNEAAVLPRLIESVAAHIDWFVIADTGSTDETRSVINAEMSKHNIPGVVLDHEWVDFGHNRSKMLRAARGCADWLLLLDADWTLERESTHIAKAGDDIPFGPQTLLQFAGGDESGLADCWLVAATGGYQMTHKVLVKGDKPWKAVGRIHELVDCDEPYTQELLGGVTWTHYADSGTRDTRAGQDEAVLRAAIIEDRNDSRSVFYLAQTLRDAGQTAEAIIWYLRRAEMGGWPQEVYLSLVYAARLGATLEQPWSDRQRLGAFLQAWSLLPDRLEALYELVLWLRVNERWEAAWLLLQSTAVPRVYVMPGDAMWGEGWISDYGLRFEESILAYWVGEHRRAIDLCGLLLEDEAVPADTKVRVAANMALSVDVLNRDAIARVSSGG